jgi:small subunit ribosomal protein S12
MATINQRIKHKGCIKFIKYKRQALNNCPQKAGKCEKVFTRTPKKPFSARRAVTYVTLRNGNYVLCKIPGETHKTHNKLAQFSQVLVGGGRVLDIPGNKYKLLFTKKSKCASLRPLDFRETARSKYGRVNMGRTKHFRLNRGKRPKTYPVD